MTVVDRQPGAALETSFANGGQISASYAEPWANPGAPLKILQVARAAKTRRCCSGLRLDLAAVALGPAVPDRVPAVAHAAQHDPVPEPRAVLARLPAGRCARRPASQYDQLERGILQFYTDPTEFDARRRGGRR